MKNAVKAKEEFSSLIQKTNPTLARMLGDKVTIVDTVLYSAKSIGGSTTIDLMQASDTMKEGITNLNNAMLEANNYMLLTGIRLQNCTNPSGTQTGGAVLTADNLAAGDYTIDLLSPIINGEIEINVAGKPILPRTSCQVFAMPKSGSFYLKGYFALDCPKLIVPQAKIVPTLRLYKGFYAGTGAESGYKYDVGVRLELHGVRTVGGI